MATNNGWYVRICRNQTETSQIRLEVGRGGDRDSHRYWRDWRTSDPDELDLPEDLRTVKEIWIKGVVYPLGSKRNANMCVLYRDHVTQKMTFDADEEHETSQTDQDSCDC